MSLTITAVLIDHIRRSVVEFFDKRFIYTVALSNA
jgi:hypothetical protein